MMNHSNVNNQQSQSAVSEHQEGEFLLSLVGWTWTLWWKADFSNHWTMLSH